MMTLEEAFSIDPIFDRAKRQTERINREVAKMTEGWLRKAIEAGPGINLARSGPHTSDDGFAITYEFQLIAPGAEPEIRMPCIIYKQPDLTEGERIRLLDGRHDWREDRWDDHCGVPDCGHPCCERFVR